ncbi:hypothetical protein THIARS_60147 [Thiomonas delicata]|uniref:Uncharacterized protein n=1 Tax=Thiomonas delicata TaxID=364030 RepID=A0A238D2M6_THIDL|nr:hypothetical protein THIARS_60147 [Thiomonas delicata]
MAPIILRLASSPAGPIAALIGDRARLWMRGADSANTHPRRDSSHFGRKNRHRAAKQRAQCFDGQRHASDTLPPQNECCICHPQADTYSVRICLLAGDSPHTPGNIHPLLPQDDIWLKPSARGRPMKRN